MDVTAKAPAVGAEPATGSTRLAARIPPELHALIKHAADISGRTITDFVVEAATAAAQRTVEQSSVVRLSLEDQEAFAAALLNPPKPNAALERAFIRRTQLLRAE